MGWLDRGLAPYAVTALILSLAPVWGPTNLASTRLQIVIVSGRCNHWLSPLHNDTTTL
jgi:hypothetical protein